jgi:2-polyprenyl-3-methyl-5-hydroxy-6-metoxy-1,4-benzoquinol methylase
MNSNRLGRIIVKAEREVAYSSPDHIMPAGTRGDNSRNRRFNRKLYNLFAYNAILKILDIGCAGGGFVKDCIDDGHIAIGLEGSDYSKQHHRAEWAVIPDFLFTCDVTGDYDILIEEPGSVNRLQFDVITSWEVMEHIAENNLDKLISNVKKHLSPGGLWIMSINNTNEEVVNGVRLHQTLQTKQWWLEKFRSHGLESLEKYVRYFNTQFVRGPKYRAAGSFHLVLCPDTAKAPPVPHESFIIRIYDRWLGSRPQTILRNLLVGPDMK